jgi:hypothetical protein
MATVETIANVCARCAHFECDADVVEASLRGVGSLSSVYASVRSDDGVCRLHDRYLQSRSSCSQFAVRRA